MGEEMVRQGAGVSIVLFGALLSTAGLPLLFLDIQDPLLRFILAAVTAVGGVGLAVALLIGTFLPESRTRSPRLGFRPGIGRGHHFAEPHFSCVAARRRSRRVFPFWS